MAVTVTHSISHVIFSLLCVFAAIFILDLSAPLQALGLGAQAPQTLSGRSLRRTSDASALGDATARIVMTINIMRIVSPNGRIISFETLHTEV